MIQVRMKDVPWGEIANHFVNAPPNAPEIWEKKMRNKIVSLTGITEPFTIVHKDGTERTLMGYETMERLIGEDGYYWACEICAEIGD